MPDMTEQDTYSRLALRWAGDAWGWLDYVPGTGTLQQILRENFSEEEARALSEIPLKAVPLDPFSLDEIVTHSSFPRDKLEQILDGIAARGLIFSRQTQDGQKIYAPIVSSFGFPQTWYWSGGDDPRARRMSQLQLSDMAYVGAIYDMYTKASTKLFRYVPATEAIDPTWQNVYPTETIEKAIRQAKKIALAHCACRSMFGFRDIPDGPPLEVCMKLNDLAEFLIAAGLAREITPEQAIEVTKKAEAAGLVHFTDNTAERMQHVCNCYSDACWNVGAIKRRQVPRDVLMATYFLRETDEDRCSACENCVSICPVQAVKIENEVAHVDQDWCIGCGVCVPVCSSDAIRLVEKEHKPQQSSNFTELYVRIVDERTSVVKVAGKQA